MSRARAGQLWKAEIILPMPSPVGNTHQCQGFAPSKGRKCTRPIGKEWIAKRTKYLDELTYMSFEDATKSPILREVALLCLCLRDHAKDPKYVDKEVKRLQALLIEANAAEKKVWDSNQFYD